MQNVIYKGYDNPVIIQFGFSGDFLANGLNNFTEVKITIGNEIYSTVTTPDNLSISSSNELKLSIGDVTALDVGDYTIEVVGFSTTYNDGYLLSGDKNPILSNVTIK